MKIKGDVITNASTKNKVKVVQLYKIFKTIFNKHNFYFKTDQLYYKSTYCMNC